MASIYDIPIPMPRTARPGGYAPAPSSSNPMSGFANGLANHANLLLALGSGLLGGKNWAQGLANAGEAGMQGAQVDRQNAKDQAALDQQNADRQASIDWLKQNAPTFATLPPTQGFQLAAADMAAKRAAATQQAGWAHDLQLAQLQHDWQQSDPLRQAQIAETLAQADALKNKRPDMPTSVEEFLYSLKNPDFATFLQTGKKPLVEVNTGDNSSKFKDKADELAASRMSDYISSGNDAQQFLGDMQTLAEISKNLNTGKGAQILNALGPYAQMAGINIDGLPEAQAFSAITSRLAPRMRAPGSGSSSDRDVSMFLDSLPELGKTPEGNAIINQTLQAVQQSKIAAAEIASRAFSAPDDPGHISWQEADKQIRNIANPYEAFNKYRAGQDGKGGIMPEGTVIQNDRGDRMVLQNGQWVPL